ncbi:F-box domain containing protein [Pandoravirus salinus]|uniref:F-box domain containing protein n=1 Tax=Pandoravirus salinus TaxID=1349410 RepID=S4W5V7_9VIRU|nr:F-box domain [Pandoravirus salinus]AGO85785.2 F-box domain containing protein [Pandoravirus salinus]
MRANQKDGRGHGPAERPREQIDTMHAACEPVCYPQRTRAMLGDKGTALRVAPAAGARCTATDTGASPAPETTLKRPWRDIVGGLVENSQPARLGHHLWQGDSVKRRRALGEDGDKRTTLAPVSDDDTIDGSEKLPEEICLLIAEYCDLSDLCRLACASRKWHRVVADPRVWKTAYGRHLPACALPHRCRGVVTDAIADAAFFVGGLAALGVPDNIHPIDTAAESVSHCVDMDTDAETQDTIGDPRRPVVVQEIDSGAVSAEPPACIPSWAVSIGEVLARSCARVARSSGQAQTRTQTHVRDASLGTAATHRPSCRHVPPSLCGAFGLAAPRPRPAVTDSGGPRLVCNASTRSGAAHRSERPSDHLRRVFEWPSRLETPGAHRAVLFTDGRSYANAIDDVSMVLLLVDADGRTLWALASASPSPTLTIDSVDWCVAGPFAPSEIAMPDGTKTLTSATDGTFEHGALSRAPTPRALDETAPGMPTAVHFGALLVGRRADGTLVCVPTSRAPTFLSTVHGLLRNVDGPCVMRARGSGALYRGLACRGLRTGQGTARAANGDLVYAGHWDADLPAGEGTLYASGDRIVFKGLFADGMPDGGAGLLCLPPRPGMERACKVWAARWVRVQQGTTHWTLPRGKGHICLDDGTRLDCMWDPGAERPPVVMRVHVPAGSPLALDGAPCVLDLTVRPPSLYDEAARLLSLSSDDDDRAGVTSLGLVRDTSRRRRRGAQGIEVPADVRRRRSAKARWTARIPAPFVAAPMSLWPPEFVAKPGDWVAHTLARPTLRFAVDLAPHRPGRIVVDLLDH